MKSWVIALVLSLLVGGTAHRGPIRKCVHRVNGTVYCVVIPTYNDGKWHTNSPRR